VVFYLGGVFLAADYPRGFDGDAGGKGGRKRV
jgi:hypothetical protein